MTSSRAVLLALTLSLVPEIAQAVTLELISGAGPVPDTFGTSSRPAMSAGGRYVAFLSDAPNLVPGQMDDAFSPDVFLHDRVAGTTTLVSHAAGAPTRAARLEGTQAPPELSISADGRFVAFSSSGVDLAPGAIDFNESTDVFLWDRVTGTTALVSHGASSPFMAAAGASYGARLSADGSFVAFTSTAADLVAGQSGPAPGGQTAGVFLWSRAANTLTLVSRRAGTVATGANQPSLATGISADGGTVVFTTFATDLLSNVIDANTSADVYAWQRSTNTLSLVSRFASALNGAAGAAPDFAAVSADGRFVAFASTSEFLIPVQGPSDVPGVPTLNAFLYDRATGEMRLASHTIDPLPTGAGALGGIAMSADGRYVAFSSYATNLVPGQLDTNSRLDAFVWDRVTNLVALASHSRQGADMAGSVGAATGPSIAAEPSFSADGRFLAFSSLAVDLVPGQTDRPDTADVFLYDQTTRSVTLVSRTRASVSTAGNGRSFSPVLSADGGMVAFLSQAADLGEGQTDPYGFADLFLYRRSAGETTSPSRRDPGLPPPLTPPYPSTLGSLSADGQLVVFQDGDRVFLRDTVTDTTTRLTPPIPGPYRRESSRNPLLSADGRFAAFVSTPSGPEEVPPQDFIDGLYLYDRADGTFTLVNRGFGPGPTDGSAASFALSADARYTAYQCTLCALVPGHPRTGSIDLPEIFLYDRLTGLNTLVSHSSSSPTARPDGGSYAPAISADGRYVAFWSHATDLVPGQVDAPDTLDLFVFDRGTGGIEIATHVPGSPGRAAGLSSSPASSAIPAEMSADGRFIAFQSDLPNLVPGQVDTNGRADFFLRDQGTHTTVLVSHAASSAVTAGSAPAFPAELEDEVSMSADGRFLVYASPATGLVAGASDLNNARDVFLYDRLTNASSLVSHTAGAPLVTANGDSKVPRISAGGSHVAFLSAAGDLTLEVTDPYTLPDLYVRDRNAGTTILVAPALASQLSADGRRIAFTTSAPLVPGDYNGTADVYLRDQDGHVAVPSCRLLDTRRRAERPILTSTLLRTINVHGSCGIPATAKEVLVEVTVFNPSDKGNLRFYAGDLEAPPSGILRFERATNRTELFTLPLSRDGRLTIVPFVRGQGTVHVAVEVHGYGD